MEGGLFQAISVNVMENHIDGAVLDPRLKDLLARWRQARGGRRMPRPGDFSLVDMPDLMANLLLVEVVWPGPRFRYRRVGWALGRFVAIDVENRFVDEMPNRFYRRIAGQAYQEVLDSRAPTYAVRTFIQDFWFARYERLLLPASEDDHAVDAVLGAIYPVIRRRAEGMQG